MEQPQMTLNLIPSADGCDTQVQIAGLLDTVVSAEFVGALLRLLSDCSGQPVCVALPVDVAPTDWFELWGEALSNAPAGSVEIRFALMQDLHSDGAQP